MDTGKILLSGVIVWITSAAFGWLTCGWLFNWVYQIPPTNIWAAPETMMGNMPWINLIGFIAAIIFAGVYAYLYETFPGEGARKGIRYGFIVWLVGALSGMAIMPFYTTIAATVVIYWIINALVIKLINGAVVGIVYKPKMKE